MSMMDLDGRCRLDWHAFTAIRVVANDFGVAETAILGQSRAKADIAFARQVAMYLCHVVYQLSYKDVAAAFGRDRTTVQHACALVEDARDRVALEQRLDKLEHRLKQLADLRREGQVKRHGRMAEIVAGTAYAPINRVP